MHQPTPLIAARFLCGLALLAAFTGCSSNGDDDSDSDRREPMSNRTITLGSGARESVTLNLAETAVVQFRDTEAGYTWRALPSQIDESVVRITPAKVQASTVQQSFTIRGSRTGRETVEFVQTKVGEKDGKPAARAQLQVQVGQ